MNAMAIPSKAEAIYAKTANDRFKGSFESWLWGLDDYGDGLPFYALSVMADADGGERVFHGRRVGAD